MARLQITHSEMVIASNKLMYFILVTYKSNYFDLLNIKIRFQLYKKHKMNLLYFLTYG